VIVVLPVCQVCGRQPAIQITVRRHIGMIILQKFVRAKPTLCRVHGEQVVKAFLKKTLVEGWWGIISFFVNFFVIAADLAELSRLRKLAPPTP